MDPALWELLRAETGADDDRALEAIIRLARPGIEIPGVRIVSRFGTIATCRIRARDVIAVRARPDVMSLKAPRLLSPAFDPGAGPLDLAGPAEPEWRPTDARRSPALGLTGAGVVVAAIDWGVDVDSAAFRQPPDQAASSGDQTPGATRFLSFWDQRDQAGPGPEPYGYGTVHSREEIDRALQDPRPYERLGYHPAIADPRGRGTHGTRTMDIAAGNGRAGGPAGIAPDADLIFVHLADRNTGGLANFGDSVRLLEAVDFISRTAGSQPCAINISAGRICGPKDGTTLVERAFDELLAATPGRFVANSAGNYFRWRAHSCGTLAAGESQTLTFVSNPADITVNELEIWYDGADEFAVRIDPPGYAGGRAVCLGERSDLLVGGRAVGRIYHRKHDPNNGDNHIVAFLDPIGRAGQWTVTLEARRVSSGRFHAWIERDDSCPGCQARFARDNTNPAITIGSIASSHLPLTVGAYDGHDPARPVAAFSSAGPCRDGRSKPDLAAPGVGVLAARSAPIGASRNPGLLVRGNGTSFATPHVTGAVALCFEAAGSRLSAHQIRSLVLGSCDPAPDADSEGRLGRGYLNIPRLVADVQRALEPTAAPIAKEPTMDAEDTVVLLAAAPATAYREYLYRPHGQLARWMGDWFDVVARPGQRIRQGLREGDVLIEVTLGHTGPGRCVTLTARDFERVASWPRLAPGQLLLRPRRRTEVSEPLPVEPVIDTGGGDIGSGGTGPGRLTGLDLPLRVQVTGAPDATAAERDFGDDGAEAGPPGQADMASVPGWSEGESPDYLGGRLWTFTARTLALPVAVFCPKAARALGTVGILVYAHGLLDGCPRPAEIPGGIVTDSPFALGRIVHASGRPVVLVVPLLDWAHPGGETTFGKKHSHWHALASPDHLNGLIGEVLAELGRVQKSAAPSVSDLIIAGHSRAYDFLEPLAYSRMDKAMQEGALARLSQVWAFDTTYAGKVERWTSWLTVNPQLRIHVFYRPGSKTEVVGDEFYRERKARLAVTPVGEGHCAVPAKRMAELLNAYGSAPGEEAEEEPRPAEAPAPAAELTAEELTARIARCIGIWETNRGKDNPALRESSLDTVSGIHASMATIEQATMPYAITALRKNKTLRDRANPPLTVKELTAADARAAAVPSLLSAVAAAGAQGRAPDDFIAADRALITATGLSDDDVKTMFRAEGLKNTLAKARSDIEAAERAAREKAAVENKTEKEQAAAARSARQSALKAAIDAIAAADRLGLGEGSLRAYINTAANWGENRAAWQRKAVDNMPDNVGGRVEAVAVSDHGTALAIPTIRSRVDAEVAKVPAPSTEDIVRAVAQKNNPHEAGYGQHVWQTYRRLYVAPQPSSREPEETETEEGVESGEVEAGEAEASLESPYSRESVPEQDTQATVMFPSGATLRVVAGPSEPGQEHYDPNATGNPLLDTSQPFRSTRLSASFTVDELTQSGGMDFHIARIDPELVRCLQQLRDHVGKPVNITSGYRPYGYNDKLYRETYKKKPTKSRHSSGQAADVRIAGMSGMEIAKAAINAYGPNIGVGIADTYAHLDVRRRWAKWTYFGDGTEKNELALAEIEAYRRQHAAGPGSARPAPAAPVAPGATATVEGPTAGQFTRTTPETQRFAALVPLLDRYRGEIPLEFLLGWIDVESNGQIDVITPLGERGFFQIHPAESKDHQFQHTRLTTDPDYSVRAGIQLVGAYVELARRRYPSIPFGSELFWRIVKLQHAMGSGLTQAMLSDMTRRGVPPTSWEAIKAYELTEDAQRLHKLLRVNPGRFGRNVDAVFIHGRRIAKLPGGPIADSAGETILQGADQIRLPVDAGIAFESTDTGWRPWTDLILHRVPQQVVADLAKRGISIPRLKDAYGDINLDHYSVKISTMPSMHGKQLTPAALLAHIRRNFNAFVDTNNSSFPALDNSVDKPRWESDNPLGAVIDIQIHALPFIIDQGLVVCSRAEPHSWVFTTAHGGPARYHPVTGNRMWGIRADGNEWILFTRGADRATQLIDYVGNVIGSIWSGADALWRSFQAKVKDFICANHGSAVVIQPESNRWPWKPIQSQLSSALGEEVSSLQEDQDGQGQQELYRLPVLRDEGEAAGTASVDQRVDRWVRALGARLRPGNQVSGLVDGPETFGSILRMMHTATGPGHFIYLLGWWLDLDVPLAPLAQSAACARIPTPTGTASTLRSVLRSADAAGVQVRAMLWDQTGSSKNTAEVGWVNGLLHGAAILDNNQLSATFGSQHQKIVVVAGSEGLVACCGGIDINWDRVCPSFPQFPPPGATPPGAEAEETASIAQQASGVMAESSGGSSGGGGGDPLHDVHVRLVGPSADDLLQVFIGRWYANPEHRRLDRTKGALRGLCQPPSPASGSALVRVEQTFNATFAPPLRPVLTCATPPPEGPVTRVTERGVQQIYLTAIEQARRFIYWEDQYMVHMCAAEALRRALTHVEYIILLMADSPISDLPHRWAWRKRFVEHIRRDPLGHKLHVFVLRDAATGGIGPHTYVHAKTMMVDDELSIIGSANCNRRGWESDTEVAAAIAGDADASGRLFAGRIRQRLWAEHLGVAASVVEDPVLSAPLWWLPAPRPARTVQLPGGRTVNLSGRRVRPYDVDADTDSLSDRIKPDDWVDPPAPLPGSPCAPGGLLSVAAAQQPLVAATGAPIQTVRFAVG